MAHIGTILWAKSNAAHHDHIHVEPNTRSGGVPPLKNPGMTSGVEFIYDQLEQRFGKGAYFLAADNKTPIREVDPSVKWTHMGGWNRRYIGGATIWSQHSWWNALDIGPYYGVAGQQEFHNFLIALRDGTLEEEEAMTSPTFKNAQDIGAEAGVDPALKAAWDRAVVAGVATAHTNPDDITTAEQTMAYLDRYHSNVVAKLEARIAKLEAGGGSGGHPHTATVESVVTLK